MDSNTRKALCASIILHATILFFGVGCAAKSEGSGSRTESGSLNGVQGTASPQVFYIVPSHGPGYTLYSREVKRLVLESLANLEPGEGRVVFCPVDDHIPPLVLSRDRILTEWDDFGFMLENGPAFPSREAILPGLSRAVRQCELSKASLTICGPNLGEDIAREKQLQSAIERASKDLLVCIVTNEATPDHVELMRKIISSHLLVVYCSKRPH